VLKLGRKSASKKVCKHVTKSRICNKEWSNRGVRKLEGKKPPEKEKFVKLGMSSKKQKSIVL